MFDTFQGGVEKRKKFCPLSFKHAKIDLPEKKVSCSGFYVSDNSFHNSYWERHFEWYSQYQRELIFEKSH